MAGKGHVGNAPYGDLLQKYLDGHAMGNVRFVGAGGTDDDDHGRTPESPYLTLQHAIDAMVATNDDLILVGPGHTTTLTAAGSVTVNKAGLKIAGYGWPVPTINYTTSANASLLVTAANTVIENFLFTMTGVASVANGIHVQAAGCRLRGLEIEQGNGTNCAVLAVLTTSAADRLLIERVNAYTGSVATAAAAVRLVGGSGIVVRESSFKGLYGVAIGGIENTGTATTNLEINGCVIQNRTASSSKAVALDNASTGVIVDCRASILTGAAPFGGTGMAWVGNYYSNAPATASVLV